MKIRGIPSGDHECWCLLVTRVDYVRVTGRQPEDFDVGPFAKEGSPYQFKIYPGDLIGREFRRQLIELEIQARDLEE